MHYIGKLECIELTRYVADNFVNLNKWYFNKLLSTMRSNEKRASARAL